MANYCMKTPHEFINFQGKAWKVYADEISSLKRLNWLCKMGFMTNIEVIETRSDWLLNILIVSRGLNQLVYNDYRNGLTSVIAERLLHHGWNFQNRRS